jgi:hypothetical protein
MPALSRRRFLQGIAALTAAGGPLSARKLEASDTSSAQAWSLAGHVAEWKRDFPFPFDRRRFLSPERLSIHRIEKPRPGSGGSSPAAIQAARIAVWPLVRLDLKIRVALGPDRMSAPALEIERLGVQGPVDFVLPLHRLPGERIFYEILAREGAEAYRPLSPPRCFLNPAIRRSAVLYALGDHHGFDDRFDLAKPSTPGGSSTVDALEGRLFYDFAAKFLEKPGWRAGADSETERQIAHLPNTYHLAQALAWIIAADTLPDLIVKGGDDVGIHHYRYARQGLPAEDHEGNSWKLWLKERIIWGLLSPLVPILHVEGNHDGGGIWHNPAHPFARTARLAYWTQPGDKGRFAPAENYGVVGLASGGIELFYLDVVEHSGATGASPRRPEHFTLGPAQTRWLEDRLSRSSAEVKLIAQHHVLGGWPLDPGNVKSGGYGRGPVLTYEDQARYRDLIVPALELEAVQQPRLTELYRAYDVQAILSNHDHIWFSRPVGLTKRGRNLHFIVTGTTNDIVEEEHWWRAEAWRNDYGRPEDTAFLSSPVLSRIDVQSGRLFVKAICAGDFDSRSNLTFLPKRPAVGDILKEIMI